MSDRSYWDRYVHKYDASLRWLRARPIPHLTELASEAVRGKRRVLEVAAGTGVVTAAIAPLGSATQKWALCRAAHTWQRTQDYRAISEGAQQPATMAIP